MTAASTQPMKGRSRRGDAARDFELGSALRYPTLFRWLGVPSRTFYLTAAVLVGSLLLGGGTRDGFLSDTLLQLIALAVLLYFLWIFSAHPLTHQMKVALAFCCVIVALPLLQLVPLPPWLWTMLPSGAAPPAFEIINEAPPWMPISASPQATLLVLLSLIPPLTVFLGAVQLPYRERRWLSVILIGFGILSVFLGLVQVAQGPGSGLRFFAFTNPSEAVGFFANRNHFAAFIYSAFLFAVAWAIPSATDAGAKLSQWQLDVPPILKAIAWFTALVVLLAGETMARSRAGLALTIVALIGAFLLGLAYQTRPALLAGNLRERFRMDRLLTISPTKLLAVAIALTVIFSLQYALFRVGERFQADPVDDARLVFTPNTIDAALAYLPFGSGLGSFTSVYPLFEKPDGTLANTYANHAHNDAAEAALETGIFGLALMALFVVWLAYRAAEAWSGSKPPGASDLDVTLTRAATIVVGLLLAHSIVDYPLRTGAMAAVFAFACALLIPPPVTDESSDGVAEDAQFSFEPVPVPVHKPTRRQKPQAAPDVPAAPKGARKREWGGDINWPKEWTTQGRLPGKREDPQT